MPLSHPSIEPVLRAASRRSGLTLSDEQVVKLDSYVATLLFWRSRISLTTAATAPEIIDQHIADSFVLVPHLLEHCRVADIGSGAGFPGVPLAIVRPEVPFTLVESRRKRASFLREAIRRAAIANAQVFEGRIELADPELHGRFDFVISRAFGSVREFLQVGQDLLRVGGVAIAMKGPKGRDEANPYPGYSAPEVESYSLIGSGQRLLLKYTRL